MTVSNGNNDALRARDNASIAALFTAWQHAPTDDKPMSQPTEAKKDRLGRKSEKPGFTVIRGGMPANEARSRHKADPDRGGDTLK